MEHITLKTLAQATEQQVFNQVVTHLLTQNQQSLSARGDCLYRAGELKCAAGCLIGDDEYNEEVMEDMIWSSLAIEGVVPQEHKVLISAFQRIHDGSAPESWPNKFRQLAIDNELEMPDLLVERLIGYRLGTL